MIPLMCVADKLYLADTVIQPMDLGKPFHIQWILKTDSKQIWSYALINLYSFLCTHYKFHIDFLYILLTLHFIPTLYIDYKCIIVHSNPRRQTHNEFYKKGDAHKSTLMCDVIYSHSH